LIILDYY